MTAPAPGISTSRPGRTRSARTVDDVRGAWDAACSSARALTVGAAVLASGSTAAADVPLATGLTIAVMAVAALVDHHTRRLPDAIVLTGAIVFGITWLTTAATGTGYRPTSVALGLAVFAGPLLVLHLVAPRSMGFGDVKSAAVLGMAVGAVAWELAPWALTIAAASTALIGIAFRRTTMPFGPGLVVGALSTVAFVAAIGLNGIGLT